MYEADADSEPDELGPITKTQLSIERVEVRIDGLASDAELSRDFDGAATVRRQSKNLSLPFRQDVEDVAQGPGCFESGKTVGQFRREVSSASSSGIQRLQQGLGWAGLEDIACGTGVEGVDDVVDLRVRAQHDDSGAGHSA
jgi:hypothetical protein